ncbi:hypothetical protein [Marinivivus vitaminiproducens]|uniref:hypothetical protein n=1 Tax=Marinivivus vitaminiproducens TaxID=3035935 RepID=UPI00279E6B66|nr:hypothetical protein P4R82_09145 [Geminicoccaceae bacterium SCSIO 64248]
MSDLFRPKRRPDDGQTVPMTAMMAASVVSARTKRAIVASPGQTTKQGGEP